MSPRQFFTNHNWWGKLIGAFFGYLIAGSAGALIGILIGNFFDRGLSEHFSRPHWSYHSEKRKAVQKIFFDTTFAVMGHIAKADGHVSKQEIQMAKALMSEMGLNKGQIKEAETCFTEGKNTKFNLYQVLTRLQQASHDNPELLKLFIDIQYRAAQVDGLSLKKQQMFNNILRQFGFAPLHEQYRFYEDFDYGYTHRQTHQKQSSSSYQQYSRSTSAHTLDYAFGILEVKPSATKDEVKRAYRRLMSRNHPDKLIAKGLPQEMIKIANEKTQKIRKAYDQICESKGW